MSDYKRITIKQVNARIEKYGFELVRGDGYFYFWPIKKEDPSLYDSSVYINLLGFYTIDRWEEELLDKIKETEERDIGKPLNIKNGVIKLSGCKN